MGLFDRIRTRLVRTRTALSDGIAGLFRGGREMDAALLRELEALLFSADLGPLAAELVQDLERRHKRGEIQMEKEPWAAESISGQKYSVVVRWVEDDTRVTLGFKVDVAERTVVYEGVLGGAASPR